MQMTAVIAIEPGYSPHLTQIVEICTHCGRPLCPFCWNHATLIEEHVDLWECTNPTCKVEFHHHISEGK